MSMMEFFLTFSNGLTIATKKSILDIAVLLDSPLTDS